MILYMEAFGLHPALDEMAECTASVGHLVLVPDLFYRSGEQGPYDTRTAFFHDARRTEIRGMMQADLTPQNWTVRS